MLAVTTAAAAVLLTPLAAADAARDALAAALQVANVHFAAQQVDYSAAGRAASPLLHYWSLAVEEQFYLAWAPLVALVCVLARWRTRAVLSFVIAVLGGLSLWLAVQLTPGPWAYLGAHTRAWQFGAGALLALVAPWLARHLPRRLAGALGWGGAAALGWSVVALDEATPYPGTAALVPTLGTVAVIAAGALPGGCSRVVRLLATGPLPGGGPRVVRLVPLALAGPRDRHRGRGPGRRVAGAARAGGRERAAGGAQPPVRRGAAPPRPRGHRPAARRPGARRGGHDRRGGRRPRLRVAGAGPGGRRSGAAGAGQRRGPRGRRRGPRAAPASRTVARASRSGGAGLPRPAGLADGGGVTRGPVVPSPLTARADQARMPASCLLPPAETEPRSCRLMPPGVTRDGAPVVLLGDSHAAMWLPFAQALGARLRAPVEVLTKSGCPVAALTAENPQLGRDYAECYRWRRAAVGRVAELRPRLTVVTSSDAYRAEGTPLAAWTPLFDGLRSAGAPVVYVEDTPHPGRDVAACMSGSLDDWTACSFPRPAARRPDPVPVAAERGDLPGVYPVSVRALLCPGAPLPGGPRRRPAVPRRQPPHRHRGDAAGAGAGPAAHRRRRPALRAGLRSPRLLRGARRGTPRRWRRTHSRNPG